jgi:hypothetical protein
MTNQTPIIHETKADRVLAALMSGHSFNRFEAERRLSDHCLHSTVAELQQRRKLTIARKFETVPGYQGNPTRCCRYWITPEERQRIEDRRRLYLPNIEAANPTDQDKENGLQMNSIDNTANKNSGQLSDENKA